MLHRSKAPLRLGLAGGGTDVSPFSDQFGGIILNATINMYAYATIAPRQDSRITFHLQDRGEVFEGDSSSDLIIDGNWDLLKGIYNRVRKQFAPQMSGFDLYTYVDAPPGSGLGTSSTLVVAVLGAFVEWLKLPLGEYDIARLAYDIERIDLAMAGGKQDQYAATFGGVNFMEFFADDKVIVNPLRVRQTYLHELSHNLVLYYTQTSRVSAEIIERQQKNVKGNNRRSIDAMMNLKDQAIQMKETILKGELNAIGQILDFGWEQKKAMAEGISNPEIDKIYQTARLAGSTGGKISGAGGGGFMFFYCPENNRNSVCRALEGLGGQVKRYEFTQNGLLTWTI